MAYQAAFLALGDPTRRQVFEQLRHGPKSVGIIAAKLPVSRPAVSQHLKVLREGGFAKVRAEAQRRLYSVDAAGFQAVDAWIGQFRSFWEPKLDALATEIARGKRQRRGKPIARRPGKRA